MKKACIILPTYNEKENIIKLVPELQEVFKTIKNYKMHILVVDDKSPDGTGAQVKKLMKKYNNVELLEGDKQGLGVAYQRGFKHTMNRFDVLFMMDADFSHPPKLVPRFLSEIDSGKTFVIGSRYIKGGATPDWNWKRKLISRGGNIFARFVAGIYPINDCTSGFRAIDTNLLKKVDFAALATKGYAFLTTLLYECYRNNAKFSQIPLVFYDRKFGETKLTSNDMVEFFLNAWRIRLKDSKRMIKFGIVGGSGIFVNLGVFALMKTLLFTSFGVGNSMMLLASLTGDELSIIWNFILNHSWTFRESTNDSHVYVKLMKFHMVALMSVIINNVILFVLYTRFGMWEITAKLIGILVAFIWNYFVNLKWTWREKI